MTVTAEKIVTAAELSFVLSISTATINRWLLTGYLPQPDRRGQGNRKIWNLATIRRWNPAAAQALVAVQSVIDLPTAA